MMSIPPANPNKPAAHGSEPPAVPGQPSGDETQPVIPRGDTPQSQTSLGRRKASKTVPVPHTRPLPAPATPEEAEKHFIQQSFRVEALETRATLARCALDLSQQIASGKPNGAEPPLLVIHVGSNGRMTNIIPADEGMRDPQASKTLRESLAKTFTEIGQYYTSEKKVALQKDLAEAKRELESRKQTLLEMQHTLPRPNLKGRGIRVDLPSLEKSPELSEPDSHGPGTYAVRQDQTDGRSEKLIYDPATDTLRSPLSQEDLQPDLAPVNDPVIATLRHYQVELYQDNNATRDFDLSGDKAIFLRQGNPLSGEDSVGAPLASLPDQNDDCQGSAHSARKALLFPLLMNFMRKHGHPSATEFPKEAIYPYQLGLAVNRPNTARVLESRGNDTERERCQDLLIRVEDMHPAVAEVVARDVTGSQKTDPQMGGERSDTALSKTLTASIVRDIERLEMSRFDNGIAIEDLETYQMLEQSMSKEEWKSRASKISLDLAEFCYYWIKGLKDQGEVTHDCQVYRGGDPLEFIDTTRPLAVPIVVGAYSQQKNRMLRYELLQSYYDWQEPDDVEDEY